MKQSGFTLIEALVYIALFGLFMTGAIVAAYNLSEGSGRAQARAMLKMEGDFLLRKIELLCRDSSEVASPTVNASGTTLVVLRPDGSTVRVSLVGDNLQLDSGDGPQRLADGDVRVTELVFQHTRADGIGVDPEEVSFRFTVAAVAPNGMLVTERFPTTTVSLRK